MPEKFQRTPETQKTQKTTLADLAWWIRGVHQTQNSRSFRGERTLSGRHPNVLTRKARAPKSTAKLKTHARQCKNLKHVEKTPGSYSGKALHYTVKANDSPRMCLWVEHNTESQQGFLRGCGRRRHDLIFVRIMKSRPAWGGGRWKRTRETGAPNLRRAAVTDAEGHLSSDDE